MVNSSKDASVRMRQAPVQKERRKHRRVQLPLKARFLTTGGRECECEVVNISAGGALLNANQPPKTGERVVIYIEEMGRFEGAVVRANRTKFAISYKGHPRKTAKAADTLTELVNTGRDNANRRRHVRVEQDANASVRLEDGKTLACSILDISLTGASIEIHPRPPLGARLILGRMKAKVVRRHDKGVGVVFTGDTQKKEAAQTVPNRAPNPQTKPAPRSAPSWGAPPRNFGKKT